MSQLVQNLGFVGILAMMVIVALKLVLQDRFQPGSWKNIDNDVNISRSDVKMGTLATKWAQQVDHSEPKLVVTAFTKTAILKKSITFTNGQPFRIGRTVDNDLQIKDPTVSHHHLTIYKDDEGWYFYGEENTDTRDTKLKPIANCQDIPIADSKGKVMLEEIFVGETRLQFALHTTHTKSDNYSYAFRPRHSTNENHTVEYHIG